MLIAVAATLFFVLHQLHENEIKTRFRVRSSWSWWTWLARNLPVGHHAIAGRRFDRQRRRLHPGPEPERCHPGRGRRSIVVDHAIRLIGRTTTSTARRSSTSSRARTPRRPNDRLCRPRHVGEDGPRRSVARCSSSLCLLIVASLSPGFCRARSPGRCEGSPRRRGAAGRLRRDSAASARGPTE